MVLNDLPERVNTVPSLPRTAEDWKGIALELAEYHLNNYELLPPRERVGVGRAKRFEQIARRVRDLLGGDQRAKQLDYMTLRQRIHKSLIP
jgi:hypothetical protein